MAQLGNIGRLNSRGGKVIPDGWEAHHRPIPEGAATAKVVVHAGADPEWVWDEQAQAEVRDLGPVIWGDQPGEGWARVQQRIGTGTNAVPAGGQQVTIHRYLVAVPVGVTVDVGGWVKVVESGDPTLGLLKIVDVLKGSLRWERDLYCTDHLG